MCHCLRFTVCVTVCVTVGVNMCVGFTVCVTVCVTVGVNMCEGYNTQTNSVVLQTQTNKTNALMLVLKRDAQKL